MDAPAHLLLQWHITERCNLACKHCYQDNAVDELPLQKLLEVLEQYEELLGSWETRPTAHINFTGGEPFIRDDFFELLDAVVSSKPQIGFGILSNGTILDPARARELRARRPSFVQVSIDGTRETHDSIRGKGQHEAACNGLRLLYKARIPTMISFTANRTNYREFPDVVRLGQRLGVGKVWADRMVPIGNAQEIADAAMLPDDLREFHSIMRRTRRLAWLNIFSTTRVAMDRSLQFLAGGGPGYRCAAGDTLITVGANGTLYPCRRMPIAAGNVLVQSMSDLYRESEALRALRSQERPAECAACKHEAICAGGAKCQAYAVNGTSSVIDPGCYERSKP